MIRRLDLTCPLQGRRWLKLFRDDAVSGIRMRENLDVPKSRLGFSCRTNQHGLRGPACETANSVIFGTSFALGLAVDNGENWYELSLKPDAWFNLGLPVGIREMSELLKTLHKGLRHSAIVVYHPNFWVHCRYFHRWRMSGRSAFESMGWKTGLVECILLEVRRFVRRQKALKAGSALRIHNGGRDYFIDCTYSRFDLRNQGRLFDESLRILTEVVTSFARCLVIRVPIKQDVVARDTANPVLQETVSGYDEAWRRVASALQGQPSVTTLMAEGFSLEDFHEIDGHWNASGNRRFAELLTRERKRLNL